MTTVFISSQNESFAQLVTDLGVIREMSDRFCFKPDGYMFTPAYKAGAWNGEIRLVNAYNGQFPKGLVPEVIDALESNGYDVRLQGDGFNHFANKIPVADIESLKLPNTPYDFQMAAVERILTKKRQVILSPTGSGKSLIIYLTVRSLEQFDDDSNILIVVPTIGLVTQLFSDFKDYSVNNHWDVDSLVHTISEGSPKTTNKKITISTWQSIYNMPPAFFAKYTAIIGDEVHTFKAKSLTGIMEKASNAKIRAGLSGTLDGSVVNEMVLKGLFGPIHRVASTSDLMDRNILTSLKINAIILKYPEEICKTFGKVDYKSELDFIVTYEKRNKLICNLVNTTEGNTLVLFQFVQKHGKILQAMLQKTCPNKKVYFVYGGTPGDDRENVRKLCEQNNDVIVLASSQVFSTGINIKNLHNIVFSSPSKSKIRILQSIGRGLRKHDSKKVCKLFDIADDLRGNRKQMNHTLRHFSERIQTYMSEGFKINVKEFDI